MLTEDGRETNHCSIRVGNSVNLSAYKFLCYSWTSQLHGSGMHLVTNNCSTFQFLDFFRSLGRAHLYHSLDEIHRGLFLLLVRMDAEEIEYLELDVKAVRRQEMNLALLRHGIIADSLQRFHRCRVVDTNLFCQVVYAFHAAIPYDIFYIYIVTDQCLDVVVNIYYTYQTLTLLSEIVQECRVLAEWIISVVGEITR